MTRKQDKASRRISTGGPATINGVLYQLLWSLLRASQAHILGLERGTDGGLSAVTLVIEPSGGGGDLIVQFPEMRSVEQLKARPDGTTWSYREVVDEVIPDLYLAHDTGQTSIQYRFVTEGRMGRWLEAYRFFQSLKHRDQMPAGPLADLNDHSPLNVGMLGSGATKTELGIFHDLVAAVRKRPAVWKNEEEAATQKNLRSVLANFEFVGGQEMLAVQRGIDSHLRAIVDRIDDLPRIRDALVTELARRATQGGLLNCEQFFRDNGLDAVPLTQWSLLRDRARSVTNSQLRIFGYDAAMDVRKEGADRLLQEWKSSTPIQAITGESGSGKSWRAFAMTQSGQQFEPMCVIVSAGATIDVTLARIAELVWQEIAGHDAPIPLHRIANRIRGAFGGCIQTWLTVTLEGIDAREQAKELVRLRWEDWGVRLIMPVSEEISTGLEKASGGRCAVARVGDFSAGELQRYLNSFLGDAWPSMPAIVRNPLRKPLLADAFRQIVEDRPEQDWSPDTEYAVFAAFWKRIREREPLDQLILVRLAELYLREGRYPWSDRAVVDAGGNNDAVRRLIASGWLRDIDNRFEVPHLRLLNWACAYALYSQLRSGALDSTSLCPLLRELGDGSSRLHSNRLLFVPMDVLSLVCHDSELREGLPRLIRGLEGNYHQNEVLYRELIPTLGPAAIDALAVCLRQTIDNQYHCHLISDAIRRIGGTRASDQALVFLQDSNPLIQREACRVLKRCPTKKALDPLWQLLEIMRSRPATFLREDESDVDGLTKECLVALQECCRQMPEWLERVIGQLEQEGEAAADLAYLLAGIRDAAGSGVWRRQKHTLFRFVPSRQQRALASCIDRFGDREEVPWLIQSVSSSDNLLGAKALSVLARFSPRTAVEQLHRLSIRELALTRQWYIDYLLSIAAVESRQRIRRLMVESDNLWRIAEVYHDRLHALDVETLELLLDDLERKLIECLADAEWNDVDSLWQPFRLLGSINAKHLVDHLGTRRRTPLESALYQALQRIGPRRGLFRDSFARDEIVGLLFRIHGEGFTAAANLWLQAETCHGRGEGLEFAAKKPNADTIRLLTAITEQQELRQGFPHEQYEAAEILAEQNVWSPVIKLVKKFGTQSSRDLNNLLRHGKRPPSELVSRIVQTETKARDEFTAGDVLALGFGGEEHRPIVRGVCEQNRGDPDIERACVIALELLNDADESNVPFLQRQLSVPNNSFSATNALIANGTQPALNALWKHGGESFLGAVAINLINHLNDPTDVIREIQKTVVDAIGRGDTWDLGNLLWVTVQHIPSEAAVTQLLDDPRVEEFLRNAAFSDEGDGWVVASKASAIRCLARIDPQAAFAAARSALLSVQSHDRDYYPIILAELDSTAACEVFLRVLQTERVDFVRESIGRTLGTFDIEGQLIRQLFDEDPANRKVACYVAGWGDGSDYLVEQLTECLADPSDEVVQTAAKSVARLMIRKEAICLGQAILEASNEEERWLYLDCLIELSDPGDIHRPWPVGGPAIGGVLSFFQCKQVEQRLKKLREESERKFSAHRV